MSSSASPIKTALIRLSQVPTIRHAYQVIA